MRQSFNLTEMPISEISALKTVISDMAEKFNTKIENYRQLGNIDTDNYKLCQATLKKCTQALNLINERLLEIVEQTIKDNDTTVQNRKEGE